MPCLDDLLQHRQQVGDGRDLPIGDQDEWVLQHGLHPVRVGDEVARGIATIELHAFHHFELGGQPLRVLHSDHTVLSHLVHRLGDELSDRGISR